jgi:hypothetical protein
MAPDRRNARKPWAQEDLILLQRLVEDGVAPRLIADQLGRSITSVTIQAQKLRISFRKNSLTRALDREEAQYLRAEEPPSD